MCYTCPPAQAIEIDGSRIVLNRIADPYTHPRDLDQESTHVDAFEKGEWLYVGLIATLMVNNRPVATRDAYGIPEGQGVECAYNDVAAVGWLCASLLEDVSTEHPLRSL